MGDWTTWDGLNDAPDEEWETITFGTSAVKPQHAQQSRKDKQPLRKKVAKGFARPESAIAKKKSQMPRASGLMKVASSPLAEEKEEEEEEITSPLDPAKLAHANPFACLPDEFAEAEAAAERAEAARAAKEKAKKATFAEGVGAMVMTMKENASNTPVARRTRQAAKYISKVMSDVVAAVSPKLEAKAANGAAPKRTSRLRPVAA